MHWQGKSVLFEKLALVPAKITFISGQCDTTLPDHSAQVHTRMDKQETLKNELWT